MIIDPEVLDVGYKLLLATVVPRPIGWLSTLSRDGVANLAPFSFFTVVGRKPPVLSVTMQPRSDGVSLKDTVINIRDTGEFVTNLVTLPLAAAMHKTAFEHPSNVDEFKVAELEKAPSVVVKPPRVALSPVSMECKLDRFFSVGDVGDHVIWGRVVRFHILDDLYLGNGKVDTAAMAPVGRLAAEYSLVDNAFTTPLAEEVLKSREGRRMQRLDGLPTDFSAVSERELSPWLRK